MDSDLRSTPQALKLFHEGVLALAEISGNGIRVDVPHLQTSIAKISKEITDLREQLRADKTYAIWRKAYGEKTNLGSLTQKAHVVFDLLKYPHPGYTATSFNDDGSLKADARTRADEAAFEGIDLPFVKMHNRFEELKKFKATFLEGLLRETVDGYVHPDFPLNTADTYRGSSRNPNFQNFPRRNPELAEIIRKAFIPRKGRQLVENDFGAHEFRVAACVWRDAEMVSYATDRRKDIHRDFASKIFCLPGSCDAKEMKVCRDVTKNQFTFPTLYGSFYKQIARNIWADMDKRKIVVDGRPVREWLEAKQVRQLGACDVKSDYAPEPDSFERHMRDIEREFASTFPDFWRLKDEVYQDYRQQGGFRLATGFWIERQDGGMCKKNFVLNGMVQGPAFHCLLWTVIRLIKRLKKYRMKALAVGEIHDCCLGDVPDKELQDYLDLICEVVERELPKAWPWVIVPLAIEAEVTGVRGTETGTWWHKRNWIRDGGIWKPHDLR